MTQTNNLQAFKRALTLRIADGAERTELLEDLVSDEPLFKQFALNRAVARNVINSFFMRPRKTPAGVEPEQPENVAPDFSHAATLTKENLDLYAEDFGISLNRSMTKDNMLADFQAQWAELNQ